MLIDHTGQPIANDWRLDDGETNVAPGAKLIVAPPFDSDRIAQIFAGGAELGLVMRGEDFQNVELPDLDKVSLIALEFPKFADGRAYSAARLLRVRNGFKGELLAVGDVLPDQISYMLRSGFSTFQLSRDRDAEVIQTALSEMRHVYQAAADARQPIWAQRAAARKDNEEAVALNATPPDNESLEKVRKAS